MNVDQAIQQQDEVDKRGISLMGVKKDGRLNDSIESNDPHSVERKLNKGLKTNASVGSNLGINQTVQTSSKVNVYTKRRFTSMDKIGKEYNQETGAENVSIKLNKQCLSCSGNASVVLNAFKIACLAYSPSTVGYRAKVFSREFLLNLKQYILQSYWSI
jgi:hypothetical protein